MVNIADAIEKGELKTFSNLGITPQQLMDQGYGLLGSNVDQNVRTYFNSKFPLRETTIIPFSVTSLTGARYLQ